MWTAAMLASIRAEQKTCAGSLKRLSALVNANDSVVEFYHRLAARLSAAETYLNRRLARQPKLPDTFGWGLGHW